MNARAYTPPLGKGKTADYDVAIRLWTREMRWRRAMLNVLAARPRETILDVGCGTGSFAAMLKASEPAARVIGPVGPKLRFWSSWRTRRERAGCC